MKANYACQAIMIIFDFENLLAKITKYLSASQYYVASVVLLAQCDYVYLFYINNVLLHHNCLLHQYCFKSLKIISYLDTLYVL